MTAPASFLLRYSQ